MTHSDVADCIHQEPGAPCKCGLWELQDAEHKLNHDLAAAQARERELRAALDKVSDVACRSVYGSRPEDKPEPANRDGEELANLVRVAISAPQDTTALREFGSKVARATRAISNRHLENEAIVDAVLKGTK